jgi:hypothetical protein
MVLKNGGTFRFSPKGKTGLLYIPADIVKDSNFPLKEGTVTVEISGDKLTITNK